MTTVDQVVPFPPAIALAPDAPAAEDTSGRLDVESGSWRLLDPEADLEPFYPASDTFVTLRLADRTWTVRDCGLRMTAPGRREDGVVQVTGPWIQAVDPDPAASCVGTANAGGWAEFLESEPVASTSEGVLLLRRPGAAPSTVGDLLPVPVALPTVDRAVADDPRSWTDAARSPTRLSRRG